MRRLLPFVLLLFVWACQPEALQEPDNIVSVDPEFRFDVYEDISPSGGARKRGFWVESLKDYPCAGYAPVYSTALAGSSLSIALQGVQPPSECVGQPARLSAFLELPALDTGTYALEIRLGETLMSAGRIQVGESEWTVKIDQAQGIDFRNRDLLFLPQGMLWGEVRLSSEAQRKQAQAFVTELKAATGEAVLTPGFYSFFTATGAGTFFFHESFEAADQNEPFVRQIIGNTDDIKAILEKYRNDQTLPLSIRCFTTFGAL